MPVCLKAGKWIWYILPFKWQQLLADPLCWVVGWLAHEQQIPYAPGQQSHSTTAGPGTAVSAFSTSVGFCSCILVAFGNRHLHYIPESKKKCLTLTNEQPKQLMTTRNINYILSKSYLRLQGELKGAQAIKTTIHFLYTKIKHKLKSHSSYYFRLFDPSDLKQFEHGWTLSCHFTVSGKRS